MKANNGKSLQIIAEISDAYINEKEFHNLSTEFMLLLGILEPVSPSAKEFTLMNSIFSVCSENIDAKGLLPEIAKLAQIYMFAPLSAASADRSFSMQR